MSSRNGACMKKIIGAGLLVALTEGPMALAEPHHKEMKAHQIGATSLTAKPTAQGGEENTVDERGFINVWKLRRAALALASMPTGQDECGYEGDPEEEDIPRFKSRGARLAYERRIRIQQQQEQRQLAKCERAQKKKSLAYANALSSFNQTWRPVLVRATKLGDPIAEVVLRLCETIPMLDRTGVSADCSDSPSDQAIARRRLEAIGFQPALHNYKENNYRELERKYLDSCASLISDRRTECELRAAVQLNSRILEVLQTGYAGVTTYRYLSLDKHPDPKIDKIAEEALRLQKLGLVIAANMPRFYTPGQLEQNGDFGFGLSLARPILSGASGRPNNADEYLSGIVKRDDGSDFSDPNFQAKFYSDLDRIAQIIEANINSDLRKDPRWAVFLVERLTGRLFEAMNKNDPNRPSVAEIKAYEAQSPRRLAEKAAKEERDWRNRWLNAGTHELIDSLHTSRNTQLYYSRDSFPFNMKVIERRKGIVPALVQAYHADKSDPVFRFNLILLLTGKIKTNELSAADRLLAGKCLESALADNHPWVRTEAAYGLRFTNDGQFCKALKPFVADVDVQTEASDSFYNLNCQFQSVVPYKR